MLGLQCGFETARCSGVVSSAVEGVGAKVKGDWNGEFVAEGRTGAVVKGGGDGRALGAMPRRRSIEAKPGLDGEREQHGVQGEEQ